MAFADRPEAREVALSHVRQDLGWLPVLAAWLERFDAARLPPAKRYRDVPADIVEAAAQHFGLADDAPLWKVWDVLMLPTTFAPDFPAISEFLLFNSVGPILTRAVLGPPRPFPKISGGEAIVDFGWVAEGMIVARIGVIHSLETVLKGFDEKEPVRPNSC